ncbi:hypothetical protein Tco_0327598 [Tanacetum coccineum]|uniref:Uncharacterized protein n=1 Tax=Tanacetum coccineum TaxID=301880 RepID=A0ABQ5D288_9ASTR
MQADNGRSSHNGPTSSPYSTDPPPTTESAALNHSHSRLPRQHLQQPQSNKSRAKEIWENVEMLMQGSGRTISTKERRSVLMSTKPIRGIGNESIMTLYAFPQACDDMKIT